MTTLTGKTVLITGAGGGFGREMIRQFAQAGSRLILTDLSGEMIDRGIEHAALDGDMPLGRIVSDLSEPNGVVGLYEQVKKVGVAIDILVNNAGIATIGAFHDVPTERWRSLIQINLVSPMQLTQLLLPEMLARGGGHIVNVSSVAGFVGTRHLAAYCASKFGLRGFSEGLAADFRKQGIQVSTIYPSFSRTPILDSERFGKSKTPEFPDRIIYEPDFVVKKLIRGIRKNKRHIYPGSIPRIASMLQRFAPRLLEYAARG